MKQRKGLNTLSEKRTIRVTGKGKIKVKPDMTRITLTLEGAYPEYDETLRKSSESTDKIKDLLSDFGFERNDLKTLNFSVDTDYESYREKGEYKQRFIGYKFNHVLKVEFDSDNKRLGKILYGLAHCPLHPEFRISYIVKDAEAAKNELLGKAVKDAKEKAIVLTKAAEVNLKDILSIDYSWGEINFEVNPMDKMMLCDSCIDSDDSYDLDIEPDDIDISDTVTVVWEIE